VRPPISWRGWQLRAATVGAIKPGRWASRNLSRPSPSPHAPIKSVRRIREIPDEHAVEPRLLMNSRGLAMTSGFRADQPGESTRRHAGERFHPIHFNSHHRALTSSSCAASSRSLRSLGRLGVVYGRLRKGLSCRVVADLFVMTLDGSHGEYPLSARGVCPTSHRNGAPA